ncbi:uncharacterized protein LOC127702076 isoform X3 [Mytilus californianus]|uniref:uncharacterized protein LOC127702076 isoform X3 n=1 Tax=Mytilus californianus TaxID=6549 RepID=UPI002247547A|nr:uncharacterized protein LOC127702076 isoform X3 [Mytilus californianus]
MGDISRVQHHEIIDITVTVETGFKLENTGIDGESAVNYNTGPLKVYDKGRPQKTEIIWEELTKNKYETPGLVLAVVGDCDSYVPKPWNTTAFTTGLVNTVNGVEKSWIIYRGKTSGVSAYIDKTFKKETRKNGNILIAVQPIKNHNDKGNKQTTENLETDQQKENIDKGEQSKDNDKGREHQIQNDKEEKQPKKKEIQNTNTNDPITASLEEKLKIFQIHPENEKLDEEYLWFNTYMSNLLAQISKRWTPLLSFEDKDKKKDIDKDKTTDTDKNKKDKEKEEAKDKGNDKDKDKEKDEGKDRGKDKEKDEDKDKGKDKDKNKDSTASKQDLEMKVPVLLVVVEGDTRTIHQVKAAVKKNIPVLLIKGSGNAADLISDYLNEPIHSERDRLLKKQAPLLFGTCFLGDSFSELMKMMEKIAKFDHLITVYDIDNAAGLKMEDAVVEAIIKGWSLRDLNERNGIADSDSEENDPTTKLYKQNNQFNDKPPHVVTANQTKLDSGNSKKTNSCNKRQAQNTVTLNIVKDNNFDTSLMKNYQLTLTPGSLSLFFYIAYQFIQEKEYERKNEDLQLLLLEAIIADRVDYVSVMLQNGVEFDPTHFDKLYNETLKCENCKATDCRKIHSIHHRVTADVCEQIWCTCGDNKCIRHAEGEKSSKSQKEKNISSKRPEKKQICSTSSEDKCKRPTKGNTTSKRSADACKSARIRHNGRLMCQQLLNYATITREDRSCQQCKVHPTNDGDAGEDICCEQCKEHPKEDGNEGYFSDLLAWALFTNRVELAGVFWSKCKNQLLTAVMASNLLKNMAENASSTKDRQLHEELMNHSRLFEERVIHMQTALYEESEYEAMLLMEVMEKAWGIQVSPMICAYEHNMIDVIGHPCIQRHLNRIWYNEQTCLSIDTSAAAAKWMDWLGNACCCCVNGRDPFFRAWFSPLMTFFIHYMFVMGVIVGFSAFLMTNLRIISSIYDIGIYEWLLYLWLIADILEEFFFPILIRRNYFRSRKHTCMFKFKRFFFNVWNLLTYASYAVILMAVCMRIVNSSDFHRMTLRLYSLGLFLMYMRFLQCMIVQSYFGPKIIMIGEMLLELIKFAWILIVFMMCTGVLYHANMYPSHYDMWSTKGVQYWRIWKIISLPYWQIYGELFLEEIQGQNNANGTCTFVRTEWENNPEIERCVEYDWAVLIIAAIYMLITNLLLVNLIIALFTSRFEEVQKDSDRLWKFWRCSIIMKYRNRDPVPLNLLFLPWKLIRTNCMCKGQVKGDNVIQEAQNLHAVKCLYIQSTKTK